MGAVQAKWLDVEGSDPNLNVTPLETSCTHAYVYAVTFRCTWMTDMQWKGHAYIDTVLPL